MIRIEGDDNMCGPAAGQIFSGITSILGLTSKTDSGSTSTNTQTTVPTTTGQETAQSQEDAKKKAASAQGYQSTILTGGMGDTSTATTNKKSLLGS
jgi:hypothetical protein